MNIRREIRLGSNRKAEKNRGKGCNNPILSPCCCCYCLFRVRLARVTDFDREIVGRSIPTFQILEDLEWNDRERCAETRRRTIFYHDRLSGCQVKFLFVFVFGKGNARRLKRNGAEIRARGKRGSRRANKSSVSHANSIGKSWIRRDVAWLWPPPTYRATNILEVRGGRRNAGEKF